MKINKNIFQTMTVKFVFQIDLFDVNIFTFYSISLKNFEKF